MSRLLFSFLSFLLLIPIFSSCDSKDEPVSRQESDILGVWTDGEGRYLYFASEMEVYDLRLDAYNPDTDEDYTLMQDSYFYEPGYNFVIFMDFMKGMEEGDNDSSNWEDLVSPEVFQVTTLNKETLTWCWVDNLTDEKYKGMTKKELIGKVIQEADKGFTLLPQNYQTYTAVSADDFHAILLEYDVWQLLEE